MAQTRAIIGALYLVILLVTYGFAKESKDGTEKEVEKRSISNSAALSYNPPMPYFYSANQHHPMGFQSYTLLNYFQHLTGASFPAEILQASQRVWLYLSSANLNIDNLLRSVAHLRSLSPEDQLVALLLRVQRDLPVICSIRGDLSTLILYNMMRSYLSYVPVLEDSFPENFGILHPTGQNVVEYRQIIKHLLNRLRCCELKKQEIRTEVRYIEKPAPPPQIEYRYLEASTLPPQVVTQIQYVDKPCPTVPPTLPHTIPPPTEPPYKIFISALPVPNTGFEKMKYETMKAFLSRTDLVTLLGELHFSETATMQEKLNMLLTKSVHLQLEKQLIDAIRYYLNYSRTVGSLNLFTQKEIRKQFELTKIFTDTLDFENLSMEGKLAFDSFYSFLLDVSGEQMKGFDTWTDVKTKGEFMHVLFTYFLEQDFTPTNVKQAMEFLKPFIKMDGLGATPP